MPKKFISMGIVTIPTMVREEMNAPICMNPAPASSNIAAVGKATNGGINVIAPTSPDKITPIQPEFLPINWDMTSVLTTVSKTLISKTTANN
ncbi:hypothetical protein [Anaerotignum sp.]|uniref:hypothetical protein n=1 Tax=Anaerotignum sp. TaxID=2039241 RepID=UPI002ED63F00